MRQGEHLIFTTLFEGNMEKAANCSNCVQEHAGMAAVGAMLAAMIHYENAVYSVSLQHTSVLDSGAAMHIHPDVVSLITTNMENRTRLR